MSSWKTTQGEYTGNRVIVPLLATGIIVAAMVSLDRCGSENEPNPAATAEAPKKLASTAIQVVCREEFMRYDTPTIVQIPYNALTAHADVDVACRRDGQLTTPVRVTRVDKESLPPVPPLAGNIKFYDILTPFTGDIPIVKQSTYVSPQGTGVAMERFSFDGVAGPPEVEVIIPEPS